MAADGTGLVVAWEDRYDGATDHIFAQRLNGWGQAQWNTRGVNAVPSGPGPVTRLSLAGARPNPCVGVPRIAFSLPGDEPAILELLDVGGRRVVSRSLAGLSRGEHVVHLGEGLELGPGVYFVRLTQGNERAMRRLCILGR
jgi:hypothetical protein